MKVGIVGLGLIGGSLGIDLRSRGAKVLGVSRREETCQIALERGVADEAETGLSVLAAADIIFICTPIGAIVPTLEQLVPNLSSETVVTDVGSVKSNIVEAGSRLWANFIGGHPMAGTERQGIEAAQADLFAGAAYAITPTTTTPSKALHQVEEVARSLGSVVYTCSPQAHDRAVAWVSHLPTMASASLIAACMEETEPDILQLAQSLASSGFRDTSRVGGGNWELGLMMARYNRPQLLRSLFQYRQNLNQVIEQIEQEDWHSLEKLLKFTQHSRPHFLQ